MYRHSTGWDINARILRLRTDFENHPSNNAETSAYLDRVVKEEIAQDSALVWC